MELILFSVFLGLSLILITIGLYKQQEHSEFCLIGFFFLFLLSFVLMGNNLEYQTGQTVQITYSYSGSTLISEHHESNDTYIPYDDETSFLIPK